MSTQVDSSYLKGFISSAQQTDPLPSNIIKAYEIVHPNTLEQEVWDNIFNYNSPRYPLHYRALAKRILHENPDRAWPYRLALLMVEIELERNLSAAQTVAANFNNIDYLYNNMGPSDAAIYYYNKSLEELDFEESLGLIVLSTDPAKFNPHMNPGALETELQKYH